MNRDRFSLETIIYLIVGIISLYIFIKYFDSAFPTASIDLKVTRAEAEKIAGDFLEDRGYDLSEYENVTVFGANNRAAVFLEKTQGMEKANEMMRSEVPIWRWQSRWFKSTEKEEFRVYVDQGGEITYFSHFIEEAKEGVELEPEGALVMQAII